MSIKFIKNRLFSYKELLSFIDFSVRKKILKNPIFFISIVGQNCKLSGLVQFGSVRFGSVRGERCLASCLWAKNIDPTQSRNTCVSYCQAGKFANCHQLLVYRRTTRYSLLTSFNSSNLYFMQRALHASCTRNRYLSASRDIRCLVFLSDPPTAPRRIK